VVNQLLENASGMLMRPSGFFRTPIGRSQHFYGDRKLPFQRATVASGPPDCMHGVTLIPIFLFWFGNKIAESCGSLLDALSVAVVQIASHSSKMEKV
jgi:hypothetical protein